MDRYHYLDQIDTPQDLKKLTVKELKTLTEELRQFLIDSVLASGGHFASGLGVIELTVALHYVFNSPADPIIWDVGHQAYPHKILTERKNKINTIRKKGGLGPFPSPFESPYDAFGVGHSSTSISAALGMAIAAHELGHEEKQIIAVIGDGALTAGQAFEALNHAGDLKANMLVILNDNNMSISPNVGALNSMLTRTLSNPLLQSVRTEGAKILKNLPFSSAANIARKTEEHLKAFVENESTIFEQFGFQYFGRIDGHDLETLVSTLQNLRHKKGPKFLHITTKKGKGYKVAEDEPVTYHAVSGRKPSTATKSKDAPKPVDHAKNYTHVFSEWLCHMGEREADLAAITPAMCEGSGLTEFSKRFPNRYFDAAIAEQHAVTLGAGMAIQGLRPVVAIYSTFLQRAYDQLIHDVAIQNLPVVFAVDRAGIVGPDGATHAGTFDMAYVRCIPNMMIMAPSSEKECYQMLTTAFYANAPAMVRYPRGKGIGAEYDPNDFTTLPIGKANVIHERSNILVIGVGAMLPLATEIAEHFNGSLVDLRFVKPLDYDTLTRMAREHDLIITIEDGSIAGGAGSAISELLNEARIYKPIKHFGISDHFPEHGEREEILHDYGLHKAGLVEEIDQIIAELSPSK